MVAPDYDYMYQLGGSLGAKAPSYVERKADIELYESIKTGNFCYVFNCRQMGKSSLRVRVSDRLTQENYQCAMLDLCLIGGDTDIKASEWYRSFITSLNRSLSLLSYSEFDDWLAARDELTSAYVLYQFIEDIVLEKTKGQQVVIFVDEIDNVLSLSFDPYDLFAVIRACYNKREDNPDYARLNFALFGAATPATLMRDTSRTPFNIGKAIQLTPLELAQAQPLANGLVGWVEAPDQVLEAIFDWTGGQPYLTQRLCELVQEEGMENGAVLASMTFEKVDELVEKHILRNWQMQDEQSHLKTIQDRMLGQSQLVNRVLDLYSQVLDKGEIAVDFTDEATVELRLSGGVIQSGETLRSFNRIYQQAFSADWVAKTLSNLRPYTLPFQSWVETKDDAYFLKGKELKNAKAWAEGKSLGDLDHRYLGESQAAENRTFQKRAKAVAFISTLIALIMFGFTGTQAGRLSTIAKQLVENENDRDTAMEAQKTAEARAIEATKIAEEARKQQLIAEKKQLDAESAIAISQSDYAEAELKRKLSEKKNLQIEEENKRALTELRLVRRNVKIAQIQKSQAEEKTLRAQLLLLSEKAKILLLEESPIDALLLAIESGQLISQKNLLLSDVTAPVLSTLQQAFYPENSHHAFKEYNRFTGHRGSVHSIVFSSDGQMLATSSNDTSVKLWDLSGNEIATLLDHQGSTIISMSFSPTGNILATGNVYGVTKLWDTKNGNELVTLSDEFAPAYVSFGSDGQLLASKSGNTISIWNISNGNEVAQFVHDKTITSISFSPDGKTIAAGDSDGHVFFLDLHGNEQLSFSGHQDSISNMSFSPDGQYLATGSKDGVIKYWSIQDHSGNFQGKQLVSFIGHQTEVVDMSFSPGGRMLTTTSYGGIVKIWDVLNSHSELFKFSTSQQSATSVSFSPDEQILAIGNRNGTVRLLREWDFDKNGYVSLSPRDHYTNLTFGDTSPVNSYALNTVDFNPQGNTLALAQGDRVQLWDVSTQQPIILSQSNINSDDIVNRMLFFVQSVSFSPDGKILASGGGSETLKLWDVNGKEINTISQNDLVDCPLHKQAVPSSCLGPSITSIDFSPDGRLIAAGNNHSEVHIWGVVDGSLTTKISAHDKNFEIVSVRFSPNGRTLATGNSDGKIKLWDLDGRELATFSEQARDISSITFSPDGQLLGVGSSENVMKLWDINTNSFITLAVHGERVNSISFSPRDKIFATGSSDGKIQIWDINGKELATLSGHKGAVLNLSFSPNGQTLFSWGSDHIVRYWDFNLDSLLARSCNWLAPYLRSNPNGQQEAREGVCEEYL